MSGQPVPARITMALDSRGLYGPTVDLACGVVEPAVDDWESGRRVPTPDQVAALAFLTDYPEAFFYLPVPPIWPGPVFVCTRGGRGRGCAVVDAGEPVRQALATVTPITRATLW